MKKLIIVPKVEDFMSKTIVLEIPDEVYSSVRQQAERSGSTAEKLALETLLENFRTDGDKSTDTANVAALSKLMKFAGAADSGNLQSADNEVIDADLARSYNANR